MPLLSQLGLTPPASWLAGAPPKPDQAKASEGGGKTTAALAAIAASLKTDIAIATKLKDAATRAAMATALREAEAARKKADLIVGNPALKSELLQAAVDKAKSVHAEIKQRKAEEAEAKAAEAREAASGGKADGAQAQTPATAKTGEGVAAEAKPGTAAAKAAAAEAKVTGAAIRGDGKYGGQLDATYGTETDDGKGNKVKRVMAFGGKVWYEKVPIAYLEPKQFDVTFHLDTSMGPSIAQEGKHEGSGVGLKGSAGVTAEFQFTHSRKLLEKDAKAYTDAIDAGQGGSGKWKEIKAALLVTKGALGEAKELLKQVGKVVEGGALSVDDLADGETKKITGNLKAQGEAGGTLGAGGNSISLEVGKSRSKGIEREVKRVGASYEITLSVNSASGTKGGGGASVDAISGKHKRSHDETTSEEVKFFIDVADPKHNEKIAAIMAAADVTDLQSLRQRFKGIVSIGRKSKSATDGAETAVGALGAAVRGTEASALGESEVSGPDGKVVKTKSGKGSRGLELNARGERIVYSSSDEMTAGVDGDGKGFGQSQNREVATDFLASGKQLFDAVTKRDMATLKAIKRGDKKLLKESGQATGVNLSDASFDKLAKAAESGAAWQKELADRGWDADFDAAADWSKLRVQVQKANGDREVIGDLLRRYEAKPGRGRHGIVKTATSGTGSGFEFPPSLLPKQGLYNQIVVGDPVAPALNAGGTKECLAKLKEAEQQLKGLREDVRKTQFRSEADKHDLLDDIDRRRKEVQQATEKLAGKDGKSEEQEQGRIANEVRELKERIGDAAKREAEVFAIWEGDTKGGFWSGVDLDKLLAHMKTLRELYPKWDADVEKLRGLLAKAGPGFDPASADASKPDRKRYRELRAKTPDKTGSMKSDGV